MGKITLVLGLILVLVGAYQTSTAFKERQSLTIGAVLIGLGVVLLIVAGFTMNTSPKVEKNNIVEVVSENEEDLEDSVQIIENDEGKLLEIRLAEGEEYDIPEGWTSNIKYLDAASGKWFDVYKQPLTPEYFKERFNELSKVNLVDDTLLIKDIVIEPGEVNDVFQILFREETQIIGTLNDLGEIKILTAILEDDYVYDNVEIARNILRIATPLVKEESHFDLLDEIGLLTTDYLDEVVVTTLDDVEYRVELKITDDENYLTIFQIILSE